MNIEIKVVNITNKLYIFEISLIKTTFSFSYIYLLVKSKIESFFYNL